MDRLSPLDASFLHVEDDVNHMHIGSIGIFEGPPPPYADLTRTIAGRLHLVPRYRQKVATVPLSLARPAWVDDPHFQVEYHVRHTALPAPGGEDELRRLVGRVMSQQLDRGKPLWEIWMVEGLEDGRWSLVSKVHHCLVDGVSGAELLAVILDLSPEVPEPVDDQWNPAPEPTAAQLVSDAAVGLASSPYEQVRAAGSLLRRPRRALDAARELVKGSIALSSIVRPTPPTSLNGPIGPHRTYVWATAQLDEVKAIRVAHRGTVNDVVLALITKGFRDLLRARGEDTDDRVIRTLVPVSVRPRGATGTAEGDGTLENRVSAMFADLPVGIDDPVERLHAISAQLDDLKESKQALAGEAITSLGGFAPPMLLTLGMRVATRAARRMGNLDTVTTNVPGPQFPLYSCGRRLLRACPYVPLAAPLRVGVAIFSYDGELVFGITGDYDTAADIDVLAAGIGRGVTELLPGDGHRTGVPDSAPASGDADASDGDGDQATRRADVARSNGEVPGTTTTGATSAGTRKPGASKSRGARSRAATTGATKSEATKAGATTSGTKAGATKSGASKSGATTSGTKAGATKSGASKSGAKSRAAEPRPSKSRAAKPRPSKSRAAKPGPSKPRAATSRAAKSRAAKPRAAEPGATEAAGTKAGATRAGAETRGRPSPGTSGNG